jgi:hypothetical protein
MAVAASDRQVTPVTLLRSVTLTIVGVMWFAAAACDSPEWSAARAREVRVALFDELEPVTLKNCNLKRYGGANDGGYLMCENLIQGIQTLYSYGIDKEDNWGCQLSRQLNVPVHQYDCFTEERPSCDRGLVVFHDECVGSRTEIVDGQRFDTLANQIARNRDTASRLLVKIDIEGAEWDSLLATPNRVLDRIEQMPMELHGVDERRFLNLVRRLKTRFYLVNLHFNNFACDADLAPMPSRAYQVLWVHKRVGVLDPDAPVPAPPSPLNAPDNPKRRDCQIAR